jgi:hypothetical protein
VDGFPMISLLPQPGCYKGDAMATISIIIKTHMGFLSFVVLLAVLMS